MITVRLLVEDHCQDCPHFSPIVDNCRHYSDHMICGHEVVVRCKYKTHCGYLLNHLAKKGDKK